MNAIPPIVPVPVPASIPPMSDAAVALTLGLLLLAPMAIAGVALINSGLGRSRSAAQAMLGNLALFEHMLSRLKLKRGEVSPDGLVSRCRIGAKYAAYICA